MLRSYTSNLKFVEIDGNTVNEVFINLDKKFPGIKFRFIDERNQPSRIIFNHFNLETFKL